jgi:hypothetical protein
MDGQDRLARQFEAHRPHLLSVALRIAVVKRGRLATVMAFTFGEKGITHIEVIRI